GYVGLVAGASFAEKGYQVICVDKDASKIETLKKGIPTIHEEGLKEILEKTVIEDKTLSFTTGIAEALQKSDVVFIAVGTPMGEDGSADLKYVREVAAEIGQNMDHPLIVVDKSTVPVGTAFMVRNAIAEELDKRGESIVFHVVSNPEFLAEGRAVRDMAEPSRVVVGADDAEVLEAMKELYAPFTRRNERFYGMNVVGAELTKYAANYLLALRVSGINAIANLCEVFGADAIQVRNAVASDPRIGDKFLHPSCGYGGSCFPKDVNALVHLAKKAGVAEEILAILQAPEILNNFQKGRVADKVVKHLGEDLSGKTFALWGLAFKKDTDDMRESASINLVRELSGRGAKIIAYDPLAMEQARQIYLKDIPGISYVENMYDALDGADALVIMTETKKYLSPDFEKIAGTLKSPLIFDGRNLYNPEAMSELGIKYYGIGRGLSVKKL
ncbi:MAG: UDP-glucose/GDP-mannose dehydrogenase family protein, partial [Candidatus Moranbacteria bacterium]|nr:UDP-glucose/GDP-mannose dehydrogenase family protein [Candidatus Moranbacteria bacterium]